MNNAMLDYKNIAYVTHKYMQQYQQINTTLDWTDIINITCTDTLEQHDERLQRLRGKRDAETEEEHNARLEGYRERYLQARNTETQEEYQARLLRSRQYHNQLR